MALQLACPHCQAHAAFDERLAGAVAVCEHCRGEFTVPEPPPFAPTTLPSSPPAAPSSGSPTPQPPTQPAGSERIVPRRSSSGLVPVRRTPPIGLAAGSALAVFLLTMTLVLGARLLEKAELDAAQDPGPADDPGPAVEDANGSAGAPALPAGVDGARELVRRGVSRVSRTFDRERSALSAAETPATLLQRALAAVRTGELLVAHPSYERGRLESDRERIERAVGGRDRPPASIDLLLVAQIGMASEPAIRAACERKLSGEDAWLEAAGPYEGQLIRAGLGRDAFEAALSGEGEDALRLRVYLFYFYYRLALISRTRVTLASLSVEEDDLERALGGTPSRTRISLPDLPLPDGRLVDHGIKQPGGDGLPEPETGPEPGPEPERPPLEIGTALDFEELAGLLRDRTEEEVSRAAEDLAGDSISGRAIFLAYHAAADGRSARLEVRGEPSEGGWTVRAEGQLMVPADDRLAASLDAGTLVELAGPILSAQVRKEAGGERTLFVSMRVLKLAKSDD